ncbi:MAG: N-acetyltransferase [Sphingobacteriales bacterium]|nr:MAG: N-acetyltransferase [Sphingobacteriales bacterium]
MLEVNFNPFPVLETERLLMRELTDADAEQLFKLRTDLVALQFIGKAPMANIEEARAMITAIRNNLQDNNGITWAIALQTDPAALIGTIGYWRLIKEHFRAEIGYMLMPQYFNKGYMTEAINKANEFAFTQTAIHSIEANIDPANKASQAILIKTGFVQEAYFKENFYSNGVFTDSAIFSLVKK